MGILDEKEFYEICNYLNDKCIKFERNEETDFEDDFTLESGFNVHVSGVYTNVGHIDKQTGTFINKVNKIFIYDLEYENDPFTGKVVREVQRYVNNNLMTM